MRRTSAGPDSSGLHRYLPIGIGLEEYGRVALLLVLLPAVVTYLALGWLFERLFPPVYRWVWDDGAEINRKRIDLDDIHFPSSFLWGVASAAHQVEGDCKNNSWWRFEHSRKPDGSPTILDEQKSAAACDNWNRYEEDIGLMNRLNANSYRFSVEWSKIEPSPNEFDEDALAHYSAMIDKLLANGIVPMITLHHFSIPIWFEDMGGFEKTENIEHFVRFSKRVFAEYGKRVRYWCTFNEPSVYTAVGYIAGAFPPGKRDIPLCVKVMHNILDAHVQVYHELKSAPGGELAQIGIVKNMFVYYPHRWWHPIDRIMSGVLDHLQNESILEFFRTGHYTIRLGPIWHDYYNPKAVLANDYIGLNYYSQFRVAFSFDLRNPISMKQDPRDEMTDSNYPIYAEGFYLCIKRVAQLNLPIIITENGLADKDDRIRSLFLRKYLYALSRAMSEGCDVRGYYHWSLMDNFEWNSGYNLKFGLYEMDPKTRVRKLRPSGEYFASIVKRFRS